MRALAPTGTRGCKGTLPVTCWTSSARVTITPGTRGLQRPARLSGKAVEPPKGAWHRVWLKPRAGKSTRGAAARPRSLAPPRPHLAYRPSNTPPRTRHPDCDSPSSPRPPASHAPGLLVSAPAWVRGPSCARTRVRPRSCSRTPRLCARPGPDWILRAPRLPDTLVLGTPWYWEPRAPSPCVGGEGSGKGCVCAALEKWLLPER